MSARAATPKSLICARRPERGSQIASRHSCATILYGVTATQLRMARAALQMSATTLALRVRASRADIINFENGRAAPPQLSPVLPSLIFPHGTGRCRRQAVVSAHRGADSEAGQVGLEL